eukprot:6875509-Alexandrium_andersonii.AAC.1
MVTRTCPVCSIRDASTSACQHSQSPDHRNAIAMQSQCAKTRKQQSKAKQFAFARAAAFWHMP